MKKLLLLAIATALLAGGCACARGGDNPSTGDSSDSTTAPSINPEMKVTVRFFVDYNAITVNDIYATQTVKNFEKVTKPADPTIPPQDEFPVFKGWSTHEIVDDMKYLWDFDNDTVQTRSSTLNLFGIWVEEGGEDPDIPVDPGDVTMADFTITNCPDWTNKDGVKVFAWTWGNHTGDGGGGKWRLCTLNPSDYTEGAKVTVTINAPEDITGMLLVRCHYQTTEPNWDLKTEDTLNTPGRVYNQTADITVTSGKTSYECPGWVDYPKNNG